MALGITLEVLADVIMLPGEAFVRALSRKSKGPVRQCEGAGGQLPHGHSRGHRPLCLPQAQRRREGTVVSALLVGQLVKLFTKKLSFLKKLFGDTQSA